MKRIIGIILAVSAMATVGQAATLVYSGVMVSTAGLASSLGGSATSYYTQDVNASGGDIIGAQVNYASGTIPNLLFTDGAVSTFTVTVVSTQAVILLQDKDTITVSTNSALAASAASAKVNVSSNSLNATGGLIGSTFTLAIGLPMGGTVAQSSFTFIGGQDYQVGASSNATATNLAASINFKMNQMIASFTGFTSSARAGLTAAVPVNGSTVTLTANSSGTFANNWVIQTTTAAALTTVAFSGGQDNASFSYFNPVTGSTITLTNGVQWTSDPVYSSNTAVSMARAWNTTGGYGITAATSAATVVTFTAISSGAWANADIFFASTGALSVDLTSNLGQNAGTLQIGSNFLTIGVDFAAPVSSTTANLASGIAFGLNNSSLALGVTAQAISNVVYATATVVGPGFTLASSTQAALTIGPFTSSSPVTGIATGTSYGGLAASFVINTPTITVTGHNLQTGNEVWLSTQAGASLRPLVNNTTYYAIRIDANNFALSTTSTGSLAGVFITLTSSATKVSSETFSLNGLALTGAAMFQLQASNDGTNFTSVATGENGATISNVTFGTPYTAGSTNWPIGTLPWRYLRLLYLGPPAGAVNWSFYVNQKTSSSAR